MPTSKSSKATYCSKCNSKHGARAKFCAVCGSPLVLMSAEEVKVIIKKINADNEVEQVHHDGDNIIAFNDSIPNKLIEGDNIVSQPNTTLEASAIESNKNKEGNAIESTEKYENTNKEEGNLLWELIKEMYNHIFNINAETLNNIWKLVTRPGATMLEKSKDPLDFKSAFVYFSVSLTIYIFLSEYVFKVLEFKYLVSSRLGMDVTLIMFTILLFGICIIGFTTLGWSYSKKRANDYNFWKVFVICLYIYGTNYFLAPYDLILANIFSDQLLSYFDNCERMVAKVTDMPLALMMVYMLVMLIIKTPKFRFRIPRLLAFMILSFSYYFYMFDHVDEIEDSIEHFLHPSEKIEPAKKCQNFYIKPTSIEIAPSVA